MRVGVIVIGGLDRGRLEQEVGSGLRRWLRNVGLRIEALAKEKTTVSTGRLQRSWAHVVEGGGFSQRLIIASDVKYAPYYEFGRRPGKMPPPKALERWVKQRGMPPRAAFAVARAIGKKGVSGRYVLTEACKAVLGKAPDWRARL